MTRFEEAKSRARELDKLYPGTRHIVGLNYHIIRVRKVEDNLYKNFRETLNGGFCADIDYESDAWQKVLSEWSEFKMEEKK